MGQEVQVGLLDLVDLVHHSPHDHQVYLGDLLSLKFLGNHVHPEVRVDPFVQVGLWNPVDPLDPLDHENQLYFYLECQFDPKICRCLKQYLPRRNMKLTLSP